MSDDKIEELVARATTRTARSSDEAWLDIAVDLAATRGPVRNYDRDAFICDQLRAGRTLRSLGGELGISGERVRQVAVRCGIHERSHHVRAVDPLAVLDAVRHPSVTTLAQVARSFGIASQRASVLMADIGRRASVRRLLQWRRDRIALDRLRAFAEQLGRMPTKEELDAHGGGIWQNNVQRRFGGIQNAARRLGVPARGPGQRLASPSALVAGLPAEGNQT